MVTETIIVNDKKSVVLHFDSANNLVYRVDIHTPNNLMKESTYHHPTGISKEEAIQKYC